MAAIRPAQKEHRRSASPAGDAAAALPVTIGDADFARFQTLINRRAGIWLSPVKKALLVGRLGRRLRELGLASWRAYHEKVVEDAAELVRMLDAVTTNETHFFREPRHWEVLAGRFLPAWREQADQGLRPRRVRAWSSACSSGEEPFTLAMMLLAAFPSGWELEVLATDISTRMLERAERALWPLDKAAEIPDAYLRAYMLRGVGEQEGLMKAGPQVRSLVRFGRLNLADGHWPELGQFDLVFCRNVLIYFDRQTKGAVVSRLLDRVAPGGYLFLGHAETLAGISARARPVLPTVYAPLAAAGDAVGGAA